MRKRLDEARAPTEHHRERLIEMIGRRAIEGGHGVLGDINFLGANVAGVAHSALNPRTLVSVSWPSVRTGCLNAIPVVDHRHTDRCRVHYLLGLKAEQFGAKSSSSTASASA